MERQKLFEVPAVAETLAFWLGGTTNGLGQSKILSSIRFLFSFD